ncbi:MAG: putative Ig domain-containing protein [Steroidobacteraceae bacterium]
MNPKTLQVRATASAAILLLALSGCGGGGGGGGSSSSGSAPPPSGSSNQPPTIGGAPSTSVFSGQAYSFQPTASDPEGQTLTFSISGKPAWATFSSSNGRLSGTPTAANIGSYSGIVISVSDGTSTATLPSFTITIPNRPPTISGSPPTSVVAGQAYSFTPTASDPDGQTLAFGIANKPSWAAFNTTTGRLSGTPTASDVAAFSNVVISVSDGSASATLPSFSVTVQAAGNGSATLRWVAPTTNVDGSPLTNLAGYRVRYGTSAGALNQIVDIGNPGTTTVTISGLSAGTWYFTLASYTNVGVESAQTSPASKTIS